MANNKNGVPAVLGGGGAYLRVIKPVTTNGMLPLTANGVVQTEEHLLPLTAKKHIERKNAWLAKNNAAHLAMKIEIVGS